MSLTTTARRGSLVRRVVGHERLRPLNDLEAIDQIFRQFKTIRSPNRIRAQIVEVIIETADTRSFVMRPNLRWRGFAAGQHAVIEVEINGRRYFRSYSLSSDPAVRGRIAITVKRQAGGKVSKYLHDHLSVGDIVTLSPAVGDFVLADPAPARLLMLSAGSGVTPMMAMLRKLHGSGYSGDIRFVHVCRSQPDAIFSEEILQLAARWPALRPYWHYTSTAASRPDIATLLANVADASERQTLLCGPQGFMGMVAEHWQAAGWSDRLQMEHFTAPIRPMREPGVAAQVQCRGSGRSFVASGTQALMFDAEQAGLEVRSGCRIGICRSCRYRKSSGVVENLVTGEISTEPDEMIQLCVCVARSDIELEDL